MFKKKVTIAFDLLAGKGCNSCQFYFYENPMDSINRAVPQWELKYRLSKEDYFQELKRVKFLKYCYFHKKEEKLYGTCKEWREKCS